MKSIIFLMSVQMYHIVYKAWRRVIIVVEYQRTVLNTKEAHSSIVTYKNQALVSYEILKKNLTHVLIFYDMYYFLITLQIYRHIVPCIRRDDTLSLLSNTNIQSRSQVRPDNIYGLNIKQAPEKVKYINITTQFTGNSMSYCLNWPL